MATDLCRHALAIYSHRLIRMDVILVQYDNRNDRGLRLLMHYTEQYCIQHGYTYICPEATYNLPTYWIKVALVKHLLETRKQEGRELIVGWIDSDAVFVRDIEVPTLFQMANNKDFISCLDPGSTKDMNAGVFFVRHSTTTLAIMSDWMNCYDPSRWTLDVNGKWNTEGRWAGPDYEQGSFNEIVLPTYKSHIYLFPEKVMACYDVTYGSETIVCHFMYTHKKKIWLYNVRRNAPELTAWFAILGSLLYVSRQRLK